MFRLAAISSLALAASFFLPWWHNKDSVFFGFNNPEGYFTLFISVVVASILLFNKRKNNTRLTGTFFPFGLAIAAVVYLFYYFLKESGQPLSLAGYGIYVLALSAILLLLAGGISYFKYPKEIVAGFVCFTILSVAAYAYKFVLTDRFADVKKTKSDFMISASAFLHSFETNNVDANKKYREKIVSVSGRISEIEPVDSSVNVKFLDTTSGSYIIFSFQQGHMEEIKPLSVGDSVLIKGSCSGGDFSEILSATFISFKRSVLEQKF